MEKIRMAKMVEKAITPTRKHPEDAGIDFYASEDMLVEANSFAIVHTGITIELEQGYVAFLFPKSRSNFLLGAGVVDAGYQGEILVKVVNPTAVPLQIGCYQPIAQMVILPVVTPAVELVSLDEVHPQKSERGTSGGINQ